MKRDDNELKSEFAELYPLEQDDAFVESTLQRLPSRGMQRLWLILGNVAIWGCVLSLAVVYSPEIVRSVADVIAKMSVKQMPDYDSIAVPVAIAAVLFVAVVHSMELIDNYYRSKLRRLQDD